MLHKAWNSKGEMPYCFPRSSIKFQGHTVQNITDFDPNWAFLDYRPVVAFKSLRFALFFYTKQLSHWLHPLPRILHVTDNLNVPVNRLFTLKWRPSCLGSTWRRHQMETFSALLAFCSGNSPVTGEFPEQRPVTRSFDFFFDLRLNK